MRLVVIENVLRFCRSLQTSSKENVKVRPSWLSWRLMLIQWSSRKCLKRKVKMKILSWPNYLPQTRVFYQTQHRYWNRIVVGTSQYFQSSPLQMYATIFWERLTSTLKKPQNILKALRVINFSKMVCLFPLFAPHSPEPRLGVGVSSPVCHAEIRPLFLKYRCSTVTSHFHLHLLLLCW